MRGVIIFFAALFIILLVGVTFLYFYFEKPKQEEQNQMLVKFNIYATENSEYVKTGYVVKVDGIMYSTGDTLLEAPIIESIPINKTVVIYNKNRENQIYYTTIYQKDITGITDPQRVELKLSNPGNLTLIKNKNLDGISPILINISSSSKFNKPYLCISWSTHIISVNTIYQSIPKLERYNLYDKCYDFDREILNDTFTFPVNYKMFGTLDDKDFIKLAFIDSDCINDICSTYGKNDLNETIDVGAKDVIFEIKNN